MRAGERLNGSGAANQLSVMPAEADSGPRDRCRRDRCQPRSVSFGTPELAALIDDMFLAMHVAEGAGLAANQVGVDLRLFVFDCLDGRGGRHVGHIANPVLDVPDLAGRQT